MLHLKLGQKCVGNGGASEEKRKFRKQHYKKNQEVNTTNKVYKEGRQTTSGAERDGETVGNCHRELRFN